MKRLVINAECMVVQDILFSALRGESDVNFPISNKSHCMVFSLLALLKFFHDKSGS